MKLIVSGSRNIGLLMADRENLAGNHSWKYDGSDSN